jgi:hypothetical protein
MKQKRDKKRENRYNCKLYLFIFKYMDRIIIVQHNNIALVAPELMDYEIMCLNRNNYKATQFLDLDDF